MLHLEHTMPKRKRITTLAIAGAAAVAAIVVAMVAYNYYPGSYTAIGNVLSAAFDDASSAFAALSENVRGAIASAQSMVEQQFM